MAKPGTAVAENSQVTVLVSTGLVTIPDVTGKTGLDATRALNQQGFINVVTVQQVPPQEFPAGLVFSTSPTAGTKVPTSETITVFVAKALPSPSPSPTLSPSPSPSPSTSSPSPSPSTSGSPTTSPTH